ncbi:hypothetical protein KEM52_004737 [Ascosphaera acerosa]|nr:hypothetical protein KEM52_004737 [Ascosphaera acerosa]
MRLFPVLHVLALTAATSVASPVSLSARDESAPAPAAAAASKSESAVAPRYAILDNDWSGSASFTPLLMALKGGFEVLGVISDTANTWSRQCAYHAQAVLEVGGLQDCISVYEGATWPLLNTPERFRLWEQLHGKLPWEGVFAPYNKTLEEAGNDPTSGADPMRVVKAAIKEGFPRGTPVSSISAAQFMVDEVRKRPGQVSIYSAGALTNVALAVRLDPAFASLAKELVIMGGYVDLNMLEVTGSVLLADLQSDINLMVDPEASKIALNADFPELVVAGNVANQVMSTQAFLDEVRGYGTAYADLLADYYGTEFPFWDETAAALMVDRAIALNTTTAYIDVDVAFASPSYGNIHLYQEALKPAGVRNVTYVHQIDGRRLKDMIRDCLKTPPVCPAKAG